MDESTSAVGTVPPAPLTSSTPPEQYQAAPSNVTVADNVVNLNPTMVSPGGEGVIYVNEVDNQSQDQNAPIQNQNSSVASNQDQNSSTVTDQGQQIYIDPLQFQVENGQNQMVNGSMANNQSCPVVDNPMESVVNNAATIVTPVDLNSQNVGNVTNLRPLLVNIGQVNGDQDEGGSPSAPLGQNENLSAMIGDTALPPDASEQPGPSINPVPIVIEPPKPKVEPNLQLGTIASGTGVKPSFSPEKSLDGDRVDKVEGLVSGTNVAVAQQLKDLTVADEPVESVNSAPVKHPLYDLYSDLEKNSRYNSLMMEQEREAERRHQSLEQYQDEIYGWQITARIANISMVASWVMALVSFFFPAFFKVDQKETLSADFILFVSTVLFLMACTVLSFWVKAIRAFKIVTWVVFLLFVVIFILISLYSSNILKGDIPFVDIFMKRFNF